MKMKNENELLADMPIPKAFFRLALPAVAAQLINILYNLVDKMFIGRIPGVGNDQWVSYGRKGSSFGNNSFAGCVRMFCDFLPYEASE